MNNDEGRHGDIEVVLKQLRAENNMLKEFLSSVSYPNAFASSFNLGLGTDI